MDKFDDVSVKLKGTRKIPGPGKKIYLRVAPDAAITIDRGVYESMGMTYEEMCHPLACAMLLAKIAEGIADSVQKGGANA